MALWQHPWAIVCLSQLLEQAWKKGVQGEWGNPCQWSAGGWDCWWRSRSDRGRGRVEWSCSGQLLFFRFFLWWWNSFFQRIEMEDILSETQLLFHFHPIFLELNHEMMICWRVCINYIILTLRECHFQTSLLFRIGNPPGNQRDHVISGSTGHGTRQGSGCDPHQRGCGMLIAKATVASKWDVSVGKMPQALGCSGES